MTQTSDLTVPSGFPAANAIPDSSVRVPTRREATTEDGSGYAADAPSIDLDAFRGGDPRCCRRVLDEFSALIWSVVVSYVPDPSARDDAYQEICVRIWERRGQYSGRGSLAGWINTIAHRWCHNWLRRHRAQQLSRRRYVRWSTPLSGSAESNGDPELFADRAELKRRLTAALATLPRKQSESFVLVRVKGCTTKEAATILGVQPGTVRSNLRHATRKLRRELKDYEHGLS